MPDRPVRGVSLEVTWQLDDTTVYGTLVRPSGPGPFPTVAMVAGSGPTDRDWNSPAIPGSNGSGRLIAEALAEAGTPPCATTSAPPARTRVRTCRP